jgi:Mlc titration factor MtfA (ptsG expression regulator)
VKNTLRYILFFSFLGWLYLLLSANSAPSLANYKTVNGNKNTQKEQLKSIASENVVGVSARNISIIKTNPCQTFKVVSNAFFIHNIAIEQLYNALFADYKFYAIHSIIRFTQTDIIFPFHYFW